MPDTNERISSALCAVLTLSIKKTDFLKICFAAATLTPLAEDLPITRGAVVVESADQAVEHRQLPVAVDHDDFAVMTACDDV